VTLKTNPTNQAALPRPARTLPLRYITQLNQLEALFDPLIEAVVWNRKLPHGIQNWLAAFHMSAFPEGSFVLNPVDAAAFIMDIFEATGVSRSLMLSWFSQDVAHLTHCVADIMETPYVRLRLEAVSDDACRRFHIDNVKARLICTYRGPGTQVITTSDKPEDIETIPTGMPVLLKGKLWPEACDLLLKHRSPPIAGTGVCRLVLVLEGVHHEDIHPIYDQLYSSQRGVRHG